jgi:hypothetical protein
MLGLYRALGPFLGVISNNYLVCGILYHILDKASLYMLAFKLGHHALLKVPCSGVIKGEEGRRDL